MTGITIALDAMGGDFGPQVTVPASAQALLHFPALKVILVGDESAITQQLDLLANYDRARLSVVHAPSAIANDTRPSKALRESQGSSMRIALELVNAGQADACVSAGNTGALMALSRSILDLLPGISRPALVSELPTLGEHRTWMLDLGANVSVDADILFQFALMGSVLAEQQLGRQPTLALLNVGVEQTKGNDLVKSCASLLQNCSALNFIGFVEGDQLFIGKANVIVCDGFVGNVSLKTSEGVASLFLRAIKQVMAANPIKSFAAKWLFKRVFKQLAYLNPDQYNGASLIGLRSIVVKSHGRADCPAFLQAIAQAVQEVERELPKTIRDRLEVVLLERHH